MAYDETLAERTAEELGDEPDLSEKKMFGGLAFLINGNMAVGVSGNSLMVRVGPEEYESALDEPGVNVFDKTGRPMRGWVLVSSLSISDSDGLAYWVGRGRKFASALPPK
jgi:TfoX/Sxy family transcriptional regulator of competence genes